MYYKHDYIGVRIVQSSNEITISKVNCEKLELLMSSRNLNRSQTAKILGVEPWTVGAWLVGKREISAKYIEKINEFLKLPSTSDLLITPAVNQLIKQIYQVDDETDSLKISNALARIITETSYKLRDFSAPIVDESIMSALKIMLSTYDSYSLTKINQLITASISERIYISSISPEEYANICVKLSEIDSINSELLLDVHQDRLYAHFSVTFFDNEELNSAKSCEDTSRTELRDIQYGLQNEAQLIAEKKFIFTAFEMDSINDQWIRDDIYSLSYYIRFNHPQFKESLRLLMNRCVRVKDWVNTSGT